MVVLEEGPGCRDEYQMRELWDERKGFEEVLLVVIVHGCGAASGMEINYSGLAIDLLSNHYLSSMIT